MDNIRSSCCDIVSLAALLDEKIVGHIFFSPAELESSDGIIKGMGLAPMAVLPEYQNLGIGSKLVNKGIKILKGRKCAYVIVVGHEKYYPRFGFKPASQFDIKCQWEGVPDTAFMILVLNDKKLKGISGTAKYRDEFNDAM